ncbi:MAG: low affinity iron permease family protein [Gammaproteobacteria bacterium]
MKLNSISEAFGRFARACANALGSPAAFVANLFLILVWLVMGPLFGYSDTWQLLVNTVTTVFTYLAVFVIQNTQNRDAKAMHLKLDELISSIEGARNRFVDVEELTDEELEVFRLQFQKLQQRAAERKEDACRAFNGEPDDAGGPVAFNAVAQSVKP